MKLKGMQFERAAFIKKLNEDIVWDIIVIGGGATGLGAAVDAASRGFKTLLLEQADFAKGTSSRSTKLVHGGVRYLAQGNIAMVYEALRERGLLFKNAPHLVYEQEFIIPCYTLFNKYLYLAGLKVYDLLAGNRGFKRTGFLSVEKVRAAIPGLKTKGLLGGVRYSDGQFDDARLALNLAQTCAAQGGVVLNYMKVTGLLKTGDKVTGVKVTDAESGKEYQLNARSVINATGVFVDDILQMDKPLSQPLVRPSQGVHLVLDQSFLNGNSALMIPKTDDGRVLFAVPWHGKLLVGTTDTPVDEHSLEPVALNQEIDFIIRTAGQYLTRRPERTDVLAVFAGLRPLAAASGKGTTKEISRSHKIIVNASGLITITGGKWTTYRKMAEDVINKAINVAGLNWVKCNTRQLAIHGYSGSNQTQGPLSVYGADAQEIIELAKHQPVLNESLSDEISVTTAQIVWAVRHEMARTIEDVLARRLRILFLDARLAIQLAPKVAALMAAELGYDLEWEGLEINKFVVLANQYLLEAYYPVFPVRSNKLAI